MRITIEITREKVKEFLILTIGMMPAWVGGLYILWYCIKRSLYDLGIW
jgi:ABC-type enterobactin transport system permease subunit